MNRSRRLTWISTLALATTIGCGGGMAAEAPPAPPVAAMSAPYAPDRDADGIPSGADAPRVLEMSMSGANAKGAPPPPPAPGQSPAKKSPAPTTPSGQNNPSPPEQQVAARAQILVYTADMTLAVFQVEKELAAVEALARDVGGFLSKRDDQGITIRVPSARFDETVKRIEKIGDVLHRNVQAEDVTEEFRDLEVRLRSMKAVRDRLEGLLAKATKVEESVTIERELDRVSGEIDRIEGRLKYLRDRADLSTITVHFSPKSPETMTPSTVRLPAPWLGELGLGRLLNL